MNGRTALKHMELAPEKPKIHINKTDLMVQAGLEQGLTQAQIANKLGKHPVSICKSNKKFNRYLDSNPKMIKKSSIVRNTILDRCIAGDAAYIAAAERITNRIQEAVDPIKRPDQPQTTQNNFTTVNLIEIKELCKVERVKQSTDDLHIIDVSPQNQSENELSE
jgi:hypothetical protein